MAAAKVDRAIFLAAGCGSRLSPLTDTCPKPLIRVDGVRIIDTLLHAVIRAGISEIYVVRGYLAEQFDVLLQEFPQIQFIENPDFATTNNISSLVCAGALIQNAYMIEGDLFLRNSGLISAYQAESNYLAIPLETSTDWCFYTNEDGYITTMQVGGTYCEQMVGISYWTKADGIKLAQCARELYQNEANRGLYWDQVALDKYLPQFHLKTRHCTIDDVTEIDTVEELRALEAKLAICQRKEA